MQVRESVHVRFLDGVLSLIPTVQNAKCNGAKATVVSPCHGRVVVLHFYFDRGNARARCNHTIACKLGHLSTLSIPQACNVLAKPPPVSGGVGAGFGRARITLICASALSPGDSIRSWPSWYRVKRPTQMPVRPTQWTHSANHENERRPATAARCVALLVSPYFRRFFLHAIACHVGNFGSVDALSPP